MVKINIFAILRFSLFIYIHYIYCGGKDPKSCNEAWAPPRTISNVQEEEMVAKRDFQLSSRRQRAFRGLSEEECLLKCDEYGSSMHSGY